jgi:transposase
MQPLRLIFMRDPQVYCFHYFIGGNQWNQKLQPKESLMVKNSFLNTAQLILNRQQVSEYPIVVSCDAHSESTYSFAVDTRTGEIKQDRNIFGGAHEAAKAVIRNGSNKDVMVIYEAGYLGFSLYRILQKHGYACKVIAPNSLPERGCKKTDREDAIGNFNYYCSGLLRFVYVPDTTIECGRECLRYRFQLTWDRTAEKQKVQAMLKRQGVVFTGTKRSWTKRHYAWLKEVSLPAEVRTVLDIQLSRIEGYDTNIAKIETQLMTLINSNERFVRWYQVYYAMTGIGPLGAMTWVFEGHDLNRFPRPSNLMSYLGLVPKKNNSGKKDPALSITKAGNAYLRYVTVCAAKCYSDRRLTQKDKALKNQPQPISDLIRRCQDRLCNRYQHLRRNKKSSNKARVAVARELCAYIWEMAVIVLPQLNQTELKKAA